MRKYFLHMFTGLALLLVSTLATARTISYDTIGPIVKQDNLYRLALEVRQNNWITPQQIMIAFQRLNPEAFRGGNINGLRTGLWLRIPTVQMMRDISRLRAEILVAHQNKVWATSQQPIKPIAATKPVTANKLLTANLPTPNNDMPLLPVPALKKSIDNNSKQIKSLEGKVTGLNQQLQRKFKQARLRIDVLEDENVVLKKTYHVGE